MRHVRELHHLHYVDVAVFPGEEPVSEEAEQGSNAPIVELVNIHRLIMNFIYRKILSQMKYMGLAE